MGLSERGFTCSIASGSERAVEQVIERAPDMVLIAIEDSPAGSEMWNLSRKIKREIGLPVAILISKQALGSLDASLGIDDFVVEPWDAAEAAARIKRVLWQASNIDSKELIKCNGLAIDLARCEVSLDGKLATLTFREYELLRFLASNRGRVFTREALLNKVWGYDYYGGDRTVDVHIRRLRSKIEGAGHTFIETVRNIGYRFREET